ncbi:N2,N2-dimethylguanosine tRNA methyltransferase [Aspergillus heteromorphus CBS 117.55]|uniref:tRNA (guanine(26)-N(2))-dimethyltransferase n=1 Tax=Aspergillus heteromorphus CBS 117.55 TaxID=1448321 RepID=A0A317USC8_9EURO|nr:N2,N2-dimethylguanosine tRNA methyltransferase [Aspergillus heteromorphus CBS 117.55]PWY64525.1 N2,N2-dimethylguanosine tRNA methyltransferase [Aspergillus heteromorphus CBS 117.55]
MASSKESMTLKPDDIDTRSMISMQELDPSPVEDEFPDLETGGHFPKPQSSPSVGETGTTGGRLSSLKLGLRGHSWDSWLSAFQRYSTYPPTLFLLLHWANTSLIPLVTRSVPESEPYLLLTRPIYQSPSLEHVVLTVPVLVHVASGVTLRNIRSSRRARLYGAETRSQRNLLTFWPRMSLQARLGYSLVPLLGAHVLVNRITPLIVDGGSSGVGLGYVAHGFARAPAFWDLYYVAFVAIGVWHFAGGWASWMGWRVTTRRKERDRKKGSLEGYLGHAESEQRVRRQRKMWWTVNGIAAYNGTEYRAVKEGQAYILNPPAQDAASKATKKDLKADEHSQSVFYNPIQQFNRDLSVLAIRAYGEHTLALKKQRAERKQQKAAASGKKRKREEGDREEQTHDQTHETETVAQSKSRSLPTQQAIAPSFTILDALSATGLRALRYALEIPFTSYVVANDLSALAIQSMKLNIQYNRLEGQIRPNNGDARAFMYSLLSPGSIPTADSHAGKFDVIDLDPYGTAAPFMDAAVQGVKDGGLLCVTCTDAGVWASHGYPEKSFALYGGVPVKGPHCHEGGLRLILHGLATSAAKYGLAIEPLLSLSIDFYARVFVRVHRSPAEVKFASGKMMVVYNCDSGCGAWSTQPITQTKQRLDKKGNPFYHFGFAQGPASDSHCEHCGTRTHLSGPMWAGPLHNPHFIRRILDMLPRADRSVYHTIDRIEGMLTTALEEDLSLEPTEVSVKQKSTDASGEDIPLGNPSAIIPRLDPAARDEHPFYFSLSSLSKVLHTSTVSIDAMRGALRHLGYRSTRSHARPNSIRTDAPWEVVWEIMREWVRQKSPVREGSLKPGSPGAAIMAKSRNNVQGSLGEGHSLSLLKSDIMAASEAKDVVEMITKVQAALYRAGALQESGEKIVSHSPLAGQSETQKGIRSQSQDRTAARPDLSSLEIIFDEAMGRDAAAKKRLVRYQINPRENWGPLSRASGGR